MLPLADTVIDPRAMMVKAIDASITQVAMSASRTSNDFAFRAEAIWLKLVQ